MSYYAGLKGEPKKPHFSKFDVHFSREPLVPSTPSPEKDSLLEPTVHEKIAYQILKNEGFFGSPFILNLFYS